jgi:hypothetical protein
MLHFLVHPVKVLWRDRISLFWPIWLSMTVIVSLLAVWLVPRLAVKSYISIPSPKPQWSRAAVLSVAFLALFLGLYSAGSMVWEDFAYFDNSIFTLASLSGHDYARPVWPDQGRFFPIGHQEFNVLRHFTTSPFGYHSFRMVELVLLCALLLFLDEQLSVVARVALIAFALITPSVLISFTGLIYPEANVLLLLICLVWAVQRFERSNSPFWAVAAVLFCQLLLYYKETAFLLVLGFAGGRLLLRCWQEKGWDWKPLRVQETGLDLALLLLVGLFLGYYLAAMYPHYSTSYVNDVRLPVLQIVSIYMKLDLLAWVFVAVAVTRMFLIVRHKISPSRLWDSLALGAWGYLCGYLVLRLQSGYYLAPVDLIAIFYLGHFIINSLASMRVATRCAIAAVFAFVLLQNVSLSAYRIYERKNLIHAKAQIARVVKTEHQATGQPIRLFFPYASPYTLKDLAGYFSVRGIPIEGVTDPSGSNRAVLFLGRSITSDGPCQGALPICHVGTQPNSGDLVILLPDDPVDFSRAALCQQRQASMLLSYHPYPAIPSYLQPFVNWLHVISPLYPRPLPDHWLSASVAVWQ